MGPPLPAEQIPLRPNLSAPRDHRGGCLLRPFSQSPGAALPPADQWPLTRTRLVRQVRTHLGGDQILAA